MLAKYLHQVRSTRVVATGQAIQSGLGAAGWAEGENGALTKNYQFEDFRQASNFLQRYTDYCQKVNHTPQWSNVYNRVSVNL